MTTRKWTPVRIAKIWFDIVLVGGAVAAVLLIGYALMTPWILQTIQGSPGIDVNVPVAVGTHTLLPRMPLEVAATEPDERFRFNQARLVKAHGELRMLSTDWSLHFVSMLYPIIYLAVVFSAVWTFRRVLQSVIAGHPFAPENSVRLRRIGFVILALTACGPVAEYWVGRTVLERLTIEGVSLSPAFRFSTDGILMGILFLVLSAIFQHGNELEEERSLTV